MPWQMLWPDFLKKRLCRYLLQHYLGHFFKEKISLEQLSIDIYNGTGCVKNLNLDCDALNEQLNDASNSASGLNSKCSGSSKMSTMPIEIVSGFVGYISVYIPWHDLFNDFCKLTIKNVQITIRVKQKQQQKHQQRKAYQHQQGGTAYYDPDEDLGADEQDENCFSNNSGTNSMFSSMFVDSLMNTSMHIAQECLGEHAEHSDAYYSRKNKFKMNKNVSDNIDHNDNDDFIDPNANATTNNSNKKESLLGLEAFASTIDSILSRIKINLENIQIRIENLDTVTPFKLNENENIMSSSAMFTTKPSNGLY
jgi:hypothetical protein